MGLIVIIPAQGNSLMGLIVIVPVQGESPVGLIVLASSIILDIIKQTKFWKSNTIDHIWQPYTCNYQILLYIYVAKLDSHQSIYCKIIT